MSTLRIRVTPKAKRSEILGWAKGEEGEFLRVKLAAPPVDGKANKALVAFVAGELGLRKSQVRILRGERSRVKVLEVDAGEEAVASLGQTP
ncbi:MAG: DUF167 domain-containing protein [Verrucomicrobiales bacterium]